MKKRLLFVAFLSFLLNVNAQDVLLKEDGTRLDCKITEVSDGYIKYLRANNLSGPSYVIDKSKVLGVMYENGEFEKVAKSHNSGINRGLKERRINVSLLSSQYGGGYSLSYERFRNNHFSWVTGFSLLTDNGERSAATYPTSTLNIFKVGSRYYVKDRSGAYGGILLGIGGYSFEGSNNILSGYSTIIELGRYFKLGKKVGIDIGYSTNLGNYIWDEQGDYGFYFNSQFNIGISFKILNR